MPLASGPAWASLVVREKLASPLTAGSNALRSYLAAHGAAAAPPAGMAELADALDLGSSAARRGGSSPPSRTRVHFGVQYLLP